MQTHVQAQVEAVATGGLRYGVRVFQISGFRHQWKRGRVLGGAVRTDDLQGRGQAFWCGCAGFEVAPAMRWHSGGCRSALLMTSRRPACCTGRPRPAPVLPMVGLGQG